MASFLQRFAVFFLVLLVSSVQIDARVNKFFSKFIHTDNNVAEPTVSSPIVPSSPPVSAPPELAPTLAPFFSAPPELAPAIPPFFDESQHPYGLYGSESNDRFSPGDERPTITDLEEEILAEDTAGESYKSGDPKVNLHSNNYGNTGGYHQYQSNYDNNGYEANYRHNRDTDNYKENRYEAAEREGMSDTRFLENGKYYYDASDKNEENYLNGYGSRGNSEKESNFDGSNEFRTEFDSMEEYENYEAQKRREFVP